MSKRIKLSSLPKSLRESIMKEMGMKNKKFTSEDFIEALKNGEFAWPGGYQMYFIVDDGEALSFEAAEENKDLIIDAINDNDNNGWRVVGVDVNWEDDNLYCAHTNKKIPSAYGDGDESSLNEAATNDVVTASESDYHKAFTLGKEAFHKNLANAASDFEFNNLMKSLSKPRNSHFESSDHINMIKAWQSGWSTEKEKDGEFLNESVKRRYQDLAGIKPLSEAEHSLKNMSSLLDKAKKKVNEMPKEYGFGGGKKDHLMGILNNMNPKKMSQSDIDTCQDIIDNYLEESEVVKKKEPLTIDQLNKKAEDIAVEIWLNGLSHGVSNISVIAHAKPFWHPMDVNRKDYLVRKTDSILKDFGNKMDSLLDIYRSAKKTTGDPSEFEEKVKSIYSFMPPHLDDIIDRSKTEDQFVRNVIRMSELFLEEKIVGGLSSNKTVKDIADKHGVEASFIEQQLQAGIKVEMEHTKYGETAKEIAMDHLVEDPIYYQRLKSMEKKKNIVDEKRWKKQGK